MKDKPIIKLSDSKKNVFPVRFIYLYELTRTEIKWPRKLPQSYLNKIMIGEYIEITY